MNNAYKPLTAFERARIAYEEMLRQKQIAAHARLARDRSRTVRIVIVFAAFVGLVVGGIIYYDLVPTSLPSRDDANFSATRTGHVRSYVKGDTCRDLQFDNVSGGYVAAALVPCDTVLRKGPPPPPPTSGHRVDSVRDAFKR